MTRLWSSLRTVLEVLFVVAVAYIMVITCEACLDRCSRHVDRNATAAEKAASWTQQGGEKIK